MGPLATSQKLEYGLGKMQKNLSSLLEILIEATVSFLSLQAAAGAECLMLFDSWAGAVPAAQRDWLVTKPTQAIVQGVRKNGHQQPIIGFPKGFGDGLIQYAEKSGVDAIGIDHGVDPRWARQKFAKKYGGSGKFRSFVFDIRGRSDAA